MANRPAKYKEFIKYECYEERPFVHLTGLANAFLRPDEMLLRPVFANDGMAKKVRDGEEEVFVGQRYIGKDKLIDRRQYAKVYMDFIPLVLQEGLSMAGIKMLFYIMACLKPGTDTVTFNIKVARQRLGYKNDKSVYEGLVDLLKLGVLARVAGRDETFWINPQYVFRGDRSKLL